MTSTTFTLRPYQSACIDAVISAQARGLNRMLYVLPTGCGKTVTFAEIVRHFWQQDEERRPALVIAHREELLTQARDTILRMVPGITVEIERGSDKASRFADVIVASLQTISRAGTNRLDWLAASGASAIIYDEAHHAAADGAQRALERFGAFREPGDKKRSLLVGCTATPHRLDNKRLDGHGETVFEECVYRYTLVDAIRGGYLSDFRGYVVRTDTDLSKVRNTGGDFNEGDLGALLEEDFDRTRKAVEHWQEVARDRSTIAFCVTVEHARQVAQAFQDAGVSAEAIDGAMSSDARRDVLDRFKRGTVQVLCNCMIATEGFDHPPVSCIVMLRPTQSWSLYCQCVGRGSRLSPDTGKTDCIILDVVDNCTKHNLMNAPQLLDMPANIDLAGESLFDAYGELEALGDKAAYLPEGGGTWREVHTKAMEVQLFSVPRVPEEITAAGGYLRWMKLPHEYRLHAGITKMQVKRHAAIRETPLGYVWELMEMNRHGKERCVRRNIADTFSSAVWQAEYNARHDFKDTIYVASQSAKWTQEPPSPAQLVALQRLAREKQVKQFSVAMITTKGEAAAAIDMMKSMPTPVPSVTPPPASRPIKSAHTSRTGAYR